MIKLNIIASSGRLVWSKEWSLNRGYYLYDEFVIDYLLVGDTTLETGEWSMRIIVEYESKNGIKQDVFLVYNFLVQSWKKFGTEDDPFEEESILLKTKFWQFDSLCSNQKSIFEEEMQSCSKDAKWSSLYPDPKANLNC